MRDAMKETVVEVREMLDVSDEIAAVKRAFRDDEEPEWTVWLTVASALIIGLILMFMVTGRSKSATAGDTTISYPATWSIIDEPGAAFAAADIQSGYAFGPRISVRQLDKATLAPPPITGGQPSAEDELQTAVGSWVLQRQNQLVGYRTLGVETTTVGGKPAAKVASAYLLDSGAGGGVPGLMRAEDTIVLSGDTFAILSYSAESSRWDELSGLRDRLLSGWRIP